MPARGSYVTHEQVDIAVLLRSSVESKAAQQDRLGQVVANRAWAVP